MTTQPRVVDNDRDEITVTLNAEEIRGWSYADEAERRAKMLAAREFCEGWFQASRLRSQRVAVPEGWQDISTAPRDGSVILGFQPHVGIIQMAWDAHLQSVDKWICRNDDCPLPTHWMPLPAPPGASTQPPTDTLSSAVEAERACANKDIIISMLRAQLRMLGHMPVVVENTEAEKADLGRKVDFVSTIDALKSENERLRDALEEIAAPAAYAMPDADRVQAYRDVARDAIRALAHGDSNDR